MIFWIYKFFTFITFLGFLVLVSLNIQVNHDVHSGQSNYYYFCFV